VAAQAQQQQQSGSRKEKKLGGKRQEKKNDKVEVMRGYSFLGTNCTQEMRGREGNRFFSTGRRGG
jgi:hypothetical protein